MIINNQYYNDENIVKIYFNIESTADKIIKYLLKKTIWSYNVKEGKYYSEASYHGTTVITPYDITRAQNNIAYYKKQIETRENLDSRGHIHNSHDRELEEEEDRLKLYKERLKLQENIFNSEKLGEFDSSSGFISIHIEMPHKTYREDILQWVYKEDYKDGKKVVEKTPKKYKDDLTIESILKHLKGRTEI